MFFIIKLFIFGWIYRLDLIAIILELIYRHI